MSLCWTGLFSDALQDGCRVQQWREGQLGSVPRHESLGEGQQTLIIWMAMAIPGTQYLITRGTY